MNKRDGKNHYFIMTVWTKVFNCKIWVEIKRRLPLFKSNLPMYNLVLFKTIVYPTKRDLWYLVR